MEKIEQNRKIFFVFFFFLFLLLGSWFICFLFCFVVVVVFFFFIKLTFLFKTQFVGSLLRNTWAEYNCSVAKSN